MGLFSSTSYEYGSGISAAWDDKNTFAFEEDIMLRALVTGHSPINYLKDAVFNGHYNGLKVLRRLQKTKPVYGEFPIYGAERYSNVDRDPLDAILDEVNLRFGTSIQTGIVQVPNGAITSSNPNPELLLFSGEAVTLTASIATQVFLSQNYIYNHSKGKVSHNGFIWDVSFTTQGSITVSPNGIGRQDVVISFSRLTGEYSGGQYVTEELTFIENIATVRPSVITLMSLEHVDVKDFDNEIYTLFFLTDTAIQDTFGLGSPSKVLTSTTVDLDIIHPYTKSVLTNASTKKLVRLHTNKLPSKPVDVSDSVMREGYYRHAIDFGVALELGVKRNTAEALYTAEFFKLIAQDVIYRVGEATAYIESAIDAQVNVPAFTEFTLEIISHTGLQPATGVVAYLKEYNYLTGDFTGLVPLPNLVLPARTEFLSSVGAGTPWSGLLAVTQLGIAYTEQSQVPLHGAGNEGDIEVEVIPSIWRNVNFYSGTGHYFGEPPVISQQVFDNLNVASDSVLWELSFIGGVVSKTDKSFDIIIREWIADNTYTELKIINVTNRLPPDKFTTVDKTNNIVLPLSMHILRGMKFNDRERLASKSLFVNVIDRVKVESNLFASFIGNLLIVFSLITSISSGGLTSFLWNMAKTKLVSFILEKVMEELDIDGGALIMLAVAVAVVSNKELSFSSAESSLESVVAINDAYTQLSKAYFEIEKKEFLSEQALIKQLEEEAEYYVKLYDEEFGKDKLFDIFALVFEDSVKFFKRTLTTDTTDLLRSLDTITPSTDITKAL